MCNRRLVLCMLALAAGWLLSLSSANASLVAYWDFDNDFSATVGSPTYDATAANGASVSGVESKWGGGSAHFSAASSQYAITSASPVPGDSHSYSLWYYLDVAQTGNPYAQYSTIGTGGVGDPYTIFFNIDGDAAAPPGNDDDIIVSRVATDGTPPGAFLIYSLPDPTEHQQWVNFIATTTYDSDADTTTLEGFVNGGSIGSHTIDGKPPASDFLVFGADRGLVSRFWEGYIDDVAIYDHVLTSGEIAALQQGPAAVPEPAAFLLLATGLIASLPIVRRTRKQ